MIDYPYIPRGRTISYVSMNNSFMASAKEVAKRHSLDTTMPTASVIVKDGSIVGSSANGSNYHLTHVCERVRLGISTGQGYDLCEGCHPKNHSEVRAIQNTVNNGYATNGASLYLWGHWWCCEPCWTAIEEAGIAEVFLLEGSEVLFNKNHPENIVGKQLQ